MKKSPKPDAATAVHPAAAKAPSAEELLAARNRLILPVTAPLYTQPVQVVRGRGAWVFDETGRKYLDAFASVATVSIGHSHPLFVEKVCAQVGEVIHTGPYYLHASQTRAAARLLDLARGANPELEVCYFTNSGSEATELAALLAKNFTGCHEFVALRNSWHGRTLMSMALTGQPGWRHSLPYPSGVSFAQPCYAYRRRAGTTPSQHAQACLDDLSDVIRCCTSGRIAAFIAEPIQGAGGVIVPEPEYLAAAVETAARHGGLFIADEVQTGLGRTGEHFLAVSHWGVKPDIVTMSKGLGNGFPVGAVLTTEEIAASMRSKPHINTFGGGPAAMAAVEAVLEVYAGEKLADNAAAVGRHLLSRLLAAGDHSPHIGEVRGRGLMIGVEVVADKSSREPCAEATQRLLDACKERGVLLGRGGLFGNVLRVKPPLNLERREADLIADALADALKNL